MLTLSLVLLVVFHSKGSTVNWSFNWIFRKISKRPWTPPPPHFRKVMLQIFSEIHDRSIIYNGKNLQHNFLDWKWAPPPLELFQKFIRFGRGKLPLGGGRCACRLQERTPASATREHLVAKTDQSTPVSRHLADQGLLHKLRNHLLSWNIRVPRLNQLRNQHLHW